MNKTEPLSQLEPVPESILQAALLGGEVTLFISRYESTAMSDFKYIAAHCDILFDGRRLAFSAKLTSDTPLFGPLGWLAEKPSILINIMAEELWSTQRYLAHGFNHPRMVTLFPEGAGEAMIFVAGAHKGMRVDVAKGKPDEPPSPRPSPMDSQQPTWPPQSYRSGYQPLVRPWWERLIRSRVTLEWEERVNCKLFGPYSLRPEPAADIGTSGLSNILSQQSAEKWRRDTLMQMFNEIQTNL